MNYSLAKQLKDAGFKKDHKFDDKTGSYCLNCAYYEDYQPYVGPQRDEIEGMCHPSLSELIEACGEEFDLHTENYVGVDTNEKWSASTGCDVDGGHMNKVTGSTPEEAVTNLIFALLEAGYVFVDGKLELNKK
jgi:hypothetical protein